MGLLSLQWPLLVCVLTLSPPHTLSMVSPWALISRPLIRTQKPVRGPRRVLVSSDIRRIEQNAAMFVFILLTI